MYSCGPPHMAGQKQDAQLEHAYSSYVRIRDVALRTCQRWWTVWRSGERGWGISVLEARHDDDESQLNWLSNAAGAEEWLNTYILFLDSQKGVKKKTSYITELNWQMLLQHEYKSLSCIRVGQAAIWNSFVSSLGEKSQIFRIQSFNWTICFQIF